VGLLAHVRVSARSSCWVVGKHRSSQRHGGRVVDIEGGKLRGRIRENAAEHIRWSRRMANCLLRREQWLVNHKRGHRLWREEGMKRARSLSHIDQSPPSPQTP